MNCIIKTIVLSFSKNRRNAINALCVYAIQYAVKLFMIKINDINPDRYLGRIQSAIKSRKKELKSNNFRNSLSYKPKRSSYEHQNPTVLYLGIRLYCNVLYGHNRDFAIGKKYDVTEYLKSNELDKWVDDVSIASGLQKEYLDVPSNHWRKYPTTHKSVQFYTGVEFYRFNLN